MNNWFDEAVIEVKAGNGGKGCESYNIRADRKREPTGGNGGDGGNIWIEADRNISGLLHFKYHQHFLAEDGTQGGSTQKAGRAGKDVVVKVPCGTTIFNAVNHLRVRDLKDTGEHVMVVKGGRGGSGNQTGKPAQPGLPGIELQIRLDLKIVADIFLLGTPGSGKSSLLNSLSNARVLEKPYPFSTRIPQLGVYQTKDYADIVFCEMPSLIRGSRDGHGLGNHYLKHLERGRMFLIVLEPQNPFAESVSDAFKIVREEIGAFNEDFLKRPFFCVVNKMDCVGSKKERDKLEKQAAKWGAPVFFVSAKTGEGIKKLTQAIQRKFKNVW